MSCSRLLCAGVLLLALAPAAARAQHMPQVQPELAVPPARGPIVIDGELDDAGWDGAARASGFSETWPGDNTEPETRTEAWITWDEEKLYFAFVVEDDPASVRAHLSDRDRIWQDDYVGLILDPYDSAQWAYELFVNPLGIQGDLRWTTNGEDMGFDLVWESHGRLTDDGWQVEAAIPFQSLRFPDRTEQRWRANFWRSRPRKSRERNSWARIDRDEPCWTCQFGLLTGIRGVSSGNSFEMLPYLVASQSSSRVDGDLQGMGVDAEVGLGLRYALSSSFSAEATLNPDFSQVESDAAQLDVNTTLALFFPERRPFFQEGSDLYQSWVNAVYTRTINDPLVAGKLTGRRGRGSFALLSAWDERSPFIVPLQEQSTIARGGESLSNVARWRQAMRRDDHVGLLLTDRRHQGGGSGTVFGVDGQFRLTRNWKVEAQVLGSHTVEPDLADSNALNLRIADRLGAGTTFGDGDHTVLFDGEDYFGHAGYLSLERDGNLWAFDVDLWNYSPEFRAENGFVNQVDHLRNTVFTGLFFKPDTALFDQIAPTVSIGRIWNSEGVRKDEWVRPAVNFGFKGQTNAELGLLLSEERFAGTEFQGLTRGFLQLSSNASRRLSGGTFLEYGRSLWRDRDAPELGFGYTWDAWASLRPTSQLVVSPEVTFARLEDRQTGGAFFDGSIWRVRSDLQFSRRLFLRAVVQYSGFSERLSVEPLLSYKLNPFSVFFVGSTHGAGDLGDDPQAPFGLQDQQFFLKFQYLFRS